MSTDWPDRAARHAAGRSLRHAVPRSSHARWQPAADRQDPVAILQAQGEGRIASLLPIRYGRMRGSALAFLRGAAAIMAADLAGTPRSGLTAMSCGDCHLANFGSYATPDGQAVFDVNDFDETLTAPFEWDLKRLATSLVLSGRQSGRDAARCRKLAIRAARAYADTIDRLARRSPLEIRVARVDLAAAIDGIADHHARDQARQTLAARLQSQASGYGLIDTAAGGTLRLRENQALAVRVPEQAAVSRLAFERYVAGLPADRKALLDRYRLVDTLFKVVGVGSVGTFCAIGLFATADNEPLLLQLKQAQASVLEPFVDAAAPVPHGERVVIGQRLMQAVSDPFLGPTEADGRDFYVRRLKDSRLAALGLTIEQQGLEDYASLCGRTLARAHARSADTATLAGYLGRGRVFSHAIADFAVAYADQTERDWTLFVAAIERGVLPVAGPDDC